MLSSGHQSVRAKSPYGPTTFDHAHPVNPKHLQLRPKIACHAFLFRSGQRRNSNSLALGPIRPCTSILHPLFISVPPPLETKHTGRRTAQPMRPRGTPPVVTTSAKSHARASGKCPPQKKTLHRLKGRVRYCAACLQAPKLNKRSSPALPHRRPVHAVSPFVPTHRRSLHHLWQQTPLSSEAPQRVLKTEQCAATPWHRPCASGGNG